MQNERVIAPTEPKTDVEFVVVEGTEDEQVYAVIIHNDDVTPFDFVIQVLYNIFELQYPDAYEVTYIAHTQGNARVGTYTFAEARRRVDRAHGVARQFGYPLTFTIELQ